MKQSLLEMPVQTRQENTGSVDEHASVEGESVCRVPPLDKELQTVFDCWERNKPVSEMIPLYALSNAKWSGLKPSYTSNKLGRL